MSWVKKRVVISICIFGSIHGGRDDMALVSLLLMKNIAVPNKKSSASKIYKNDIEDEQERSYGRFFLNLFHESIEDGFFGGVQWGVAACFYQILYELSSGLITTLPDAVRGFKQLCSRSFDVLCNRPAGIVLHDLMVLIRLFDDEMSAFTDIVTHQHAIDSLFEFHGDMVKKISIHIVDYLQQHKEHYRISTQQRKWLVHLSHASSSVDAQEVVFMVELIVHNLTCILKCIDDCSTYTHIVPIAHATSFSLHKLGLLLEGNRLYNAEQGVLGAWFSGERSGKKHEENK